MSTKHAGKSAALFGIALFALILTCTGLLCASDTLAVSPPVPSVSTTLAGKGWVYTVPFAVKNKTDIEKLVSCESSGVNISRPDSDHLMSDGVLQFHRDASNVLGSGTWSDMEKLSGIQGTPIIPADAIKMADWMISHHYGPRWTCWRLQHLS